MLGKKQFSKYIKEFDFKNLFINLGWDNFNNDIPVIINGAHYNLKGIAQKRGFAIVACLPQDDGKIPLNDTRKKIENCLRKVHQEHLIIYYDSSKQEQKWQFVIEEADKPKRVREIPYQISQDTEILYQRARGLLFNLEEEDKITLVDVTSRVRENLAKNSEKVTKKFYSQFKKHYNSFLGFIEGIDELIKDNDNKDKQWYASIMMNRLMFCYFIQKRGYLDNDINYLQNKLKEVRKQAGKDQFYLFYRQFLLKLFHQGLGMPQSERKLDVELGNIPYLNGGLFDVHDLERKFPDIQIRDEAFEKIFHFFDQWNWHLDTRIESSGKDINPDVIGYIFEKYVNDRAAMGAYYTKEDITDYISKNTIIPSLFDKVKERYPIAFQENGYIWRFLKNSGDTYIYDAVKKGIHKNSRLFEDLPEDIKKGFNPQLEQKPVTDEEPHLFEIRKPWNKKAPEEIALPTETYRELIERRKHYAEIKNKIEQGEITEINDLITYNLNIRQFTQDILENTDDPDLILAFFKVIVGNIKYKESNENIIRPISILDPTCGSGAFLFAAMNILEPLYEACIEKMEQFTSELPRKFKFFHKVLADVNSEEHPNLKYYIYKSIILNNLYGVDIMHEAVEIAKLRLFLKMIGAVDVDNNKPNYGLEPLPDIDFNIKAGNTLVGFATKEELLSAIEKFEGLYAKEKLEKYKEECSLVATAYSRFQSEQFVTDKNTQKQREAKLELQSRLNSLNDKLNEYLSRIYGIIKYEQLGGKTKLFDSENTLKQQTKQYKKWLETYQPFHWFAEFYDIINENGGFDAVIGNPPYVVYNSNLIGYEVKNFETNNCNNLFAFCSERAIGFLNKNNGKFGFIVPNSSISAGQMKSLHKIVSLNKNTWISNFSWRPGKLFEGADMLLAIIICSYKREEERIYSTKYNKWYKEFRPFLFDNLSYRDINSIKINGSFPKVPYFSAKDILYKVLSNKYNINYFKLSIETKYVLFYFRAVQYWIKILAKPPIFKEDGSYKTTGEMKAIYFDDDQKRYIFICLLSSNFFFLYYIIWSSCQVINNRDLLVNFDYNKLRKENISSLISLGKELETDYQKKSKIIIRNYSKKGRKFQMEKQHFYIKKSKHIINKIDIILAQHYGFTEEELDFIINYDIKYRMGEELNNHVD